MRGLGLVVLMGLGGTAGAAPKKLASSTTATPPRFVDESSVYMQVGNSDDGYWVDVEADVFGLADKDRVRLDVKRGGKVLGTSECRYDRADIQGIGLYKYSCRVGKDKVVKGAGPIEADLVLEEDATDKEYLLRTFKANVKQWEKGNFQIEADDLLATAYLAQRPAQGDHDARLRFWITGTNSFNATLRCTVDGKPVKDIDGSVGENGTITADVMSKKRATWKWSKVEFSSTWFKVAPDGNKHENYVYLSTNPGQWACQLRRDGITLREFRFAVSPKGQVEPHPMQEASDAPPVVPQIALVDVRIPKGNGHDQRIKPDKLKKSRAFGLAWPKHASVKAIHAALPPAFENANPPPAKRVVGKLIPGASANPPRFVDESMTALFVRRDGDGYGFRLSQVVGGLSFAQANVIRLDWKQRGKVLASTKCSAEEKVGEDFVECVYRDKPLKATGPIEAQLIEYDDRDGNEYLLRTYKVTVVHPKAFGDPIWAIFPDDLLATAWVRQTEHHVKFRFWVAYENPTVDMRCSVNGTKLPDIQMSGDTSDPEIKFSYRKTQQAKEQTYVWSKVGGDTRLKAGPPPQDATKSDDRVEYLAHHPGKWDCAIRQRGKTVRQLLFTVNDQGYVEADPAQLPGPPNFKTSVPIELRFGKDILDTRVRPAAIKVSRGFGLPWPKAPKKPLPPASGLPDLR